MPAPPARLVVCDSLERYAEIAGEIEPGALELPILGAPARLAGFPVELACVDAQDWSPDRSGGVRPSAAPRSESGCCVIVDEASCRVVGSLLARATGRRALVLGRDAWEAGIDALLEGEQPTSLTFVIPLWSGPSLDLDPGWLARVLACVRARQERFEGLAWGVVLGVDPSALSLAVARAILAPLVVAAYTDEPAAVFVTGAGGCARVARMPSDPSDHHREPLQRVDLDHVRSGASLALHRRRWSALYVTGHGRAYCGALGHLCGARPLSVAPDAPAPHCVAGLDCISPVDGLREPGQPGFPRVDPRRYDAPIMILESCVAGGWSSPEWAAGTPAVAIHAFAGAASAVICSDFATMGSGADQLEPLAILRDEALREGGTIGAFVARLNQIRGAELGGALRYLIGDPELPLAFARWSSWASAPVDARHERGPELQTIHARVGPGPGFVELELGLADASGTTSYVRDEANAAGLAGVQAIDTRARSRLWIERGPEADPEADGLLVVETFATPRLPPGLLDAALVTPLLVRSWSEELRARAVPLLQAAARIESVSELLERVRGRALIGAGRELRASVALCRQAWLEAQLAAVEAACALADRGLTEERLWRGMDYRSDTIDEACPHCGIAPTLLRRYRSPPALARTQWECVACTVIEDRPTMPAPEVSLTMPRQIDPGETIEARLRLDNREGERHFALAGALLLDRDGHGVEAPPPFAVELGPGEVHEQIIELRSTGRPKVPHRYYARAPILSNGVWTLVARLVDVRPVTL